MRGRQLAVNRARWDGGGLQALLPVVEAISYSGHRHRRNESGDFVPCEILIDDLRFE